MENNLVLSIFPGIDLLGRAFEEQGYCVVRGPDLLWGGDIRTFHPPAGVFEGVIGGPPCPEHSPMRFLLEATGKKSRHGNMIPEYERVVYEAQPEWYMMENSIYAPCPVVTGYKVTKIRLSPRWIGDVQSRERLIYFGTPEGLILPVDVELFEQSEYEYAVMGDSRPAPVKMLKGGRLKKNCVLAGHGAAPGQRDVGVRQRSVEDMCELQGLPRNFTANWPFTVHGKREVIGNGVPLSMGRAIAKAVRKATESSQMLQERG